MKNFKFIFTEFPYVDIFRDIFFYTDVHPIQDIGATQGRGLQILEIN